MTTIRPFAATAAALCVALACSAAQAQRVALDPIALTVAPGESFSLNLQAEDFANAILGGGFELTFDAGVLRLDSVSIPASWEFARSGGLIDNASGTLSNAYFATFSNPVAGDFKLATLNFTAIGVGQSQVTPLPNALQPFVEDVSVSVVTPTYDFATVTVAVPEPGSVALLLGGCLALARLRARRS